MSEYIERESTVEKFEFIKQQTRSIHGRAYVDGIINVLQKIPSADVRPVVWGRWERIDGLDELDPRMRCSVCGSVETPLARHRFCPVCAADMKEGGTDG